MIELCEVLRDLDDGQPALVDEQRGVVQDSGLRSVIAVLKRIHVNQHIIRANQRYGDHAAPITVKTYKSNVRGHRACIDGPSQLVYSAERPLSCGARLWVETDARVVVYDDVAGETVELP